MDPDDPYYTQGHWSSSWDREKKTWSESSYEKERRLQFEELEAKRLEEEAESVVTPEDEDTSAG